MRGAYGRLLGLRAGKVILVVILALFGGEARASIVERVVAVVDERPIFMSDLHARARPFLLRIHAANVQPARAAALETAMYRELLDRMIDERIEADAAARAHVTVSAVEVDLALANIARAANIDVPALLAEARSQGLAEAEYREELARQILEGKLLNLRPASAESWEEARRRFCLEARRKVYVDVRL